MMTDDFGFPSRKRDQDTARKLGDFKPDEQSQPVGGLHEMDAVAARHGFVSREPQPPLRGRKKDVGPTVAINIRMPERVARPFIRYCEKHRFTYWEAVEELMKMAGEGP